MIKKRKYSKLTIAMIYLLVPTFGTLILLFTLVFVANAGSWFFDLLK